MIAACLLPAYLWVGSGAASGLHLHHTHGSSPTAYPSVHDASGEAGHDSAYCPVCYQLTTARTADASEAPALLIDLASAGERSVVCAVIPPHTFSRVGPGPRAPPRA